MCDDDYLKPIESVEASVDSTAIIEEFQNKDSIQLSLANEKIDTSFVVKDNEIQFFKKCTQNIIVKFLVLPPFSSKYSVSGFAYFIISLDCIVNLKWKEILACENLISVAFLFSIFQLFIYRKVLTIISLTSLVIPLVFHIFQNQFENILFGFWVCLILMGMNVFITFKSL